MLTYTHWTAIIITLAAVTFLGVYSMKNVKSAGDFATGGGKIGTHLVVGTIVGTLVGGASTIGTAQLAFCYGFSAWWFTLGAGLSCIFLGVFLAGPLRDSGASTAPEFLAQVYGEKTRSVACIFSSAGMFLNIIGQVLSAVALITSMFAFLSPQAAALGAIFLIIAYVIFGGVWGAGMVGILKTFLIYFTMMAVGVLAFQSGGGISGFRSALPAFPWFSLFGRGVSTDLAAGFSLLVGIISTQTYLQAVFSGRTGAVSRRGAVISGLTMIPVGLAGVFAGLYMRINFPETVPGEALPLFILEFFPDWLGGIALAALLVSVIGTGAGLVLGISTMLTRDIYKKVLRPDASDEKVLLFSRISIAAVTLLTFVFVSGSMNSLILQWSFLSMGLRGATICLPLLAGVFLPGRIHPDAGRFAVTVAPLCTIIWAFSGAKSILDPLYVGLMVSGLSLLAGMVMQKKA